MVLSVILKRSRQHIDPLTGFRWPTCDLWRCAYIPR